MEEIGIQHDFEADGGGHHDAVPQSKTKEFCLVGDGHGGGGSGDRDVLHADHFTHHATNGVGGGHQRGLKPQVTGSHHL